MNESDRSGTKPNTPEVSSGKSEETASPSSQSEGKADPESNSRKGTGDRKGKRTVVVKKNAEGIRRRSNEIVRKLDDVEFLRKNARILDLETFKERMMENTSGFGGLRNQVNFNITALVKLVFENCTEDQLTRYIFTLGISRAKMPEVLERFWNYVPLFTEFVQGRMKTETEWREKA